jgi:C1A family cysteine protease
MPRATQWYGWLRDVPDHRDVFFTPNRDHIADLDKAVDLRKNFTFAPYNQGELGSCTANAIAAAMQFEAIKAEADDVSTPSRLFIYYNERDMMGTVSADSGAMLRDGLKTVAQCGAPPEDLWEYDIDQFDKKPPKKVYLAAQDHLVLVYRRVDQSLTDMRVVLSLGFTFAFGFTAYESFESKEVARTGVMPMPGLSESVVGSHAALAVGYDDEEQHIIVRNSWGARWGDRGHFYMPYAFIQDPHLATDFWTIQLTE